MEQPLYELPEGWSFKKLGDLFHITSSKRVHKKDWKTEGVPFYRAREIVELSKRGVVDNELFITEEMYEDFSTKFGAPRENDLLITGVGTIGICYVVQEKDRIYFKDGNIIWLKNQQGNIEPRFIEYAFQSHFVNKQVHSATGAVVKTYTIVRAKNTIVPVCPLNEQKRIVAKLDALFTHIDAAITHLQETLELSKALFASALDACIDPSWELMAFDDLKMSNVIGLVRSVGQQGPSFSFPYVKMNNITRDGEMDLSEYVTVDCASDEVEKFSLANGDFLFNTRNSAELVGKTAVFEPPDNDESKPWLFNNNIMRVRFRPEVNPYFVRYLFQSSEVKTRVDSLKSNTTNVSAIYYKKLKTLLLPIPSHDEQMAAVQYLDLLSERVRSLETETQERLHQLATLKSSLLDAAFRGQL